MSLYNKIIDLQKLQQAWTKVRKNKPAAGVDGITCEQFNENSKEELKQVSEELRNHTYETLPVRIITLYKGEKARQIALYSMRDKAVQQSVAQELEKIYDPLFSGSVYAYRNGRSALEVVEKLSGEMKSGRYKYLIKLDIQSFFDRIQWTTLKEKLMKKISEEDVIDLIGQDVRARSLEETGEMTEKRIGIHQGSGISPVLSNIYLMEFDSWMSSLDVCYVRYSDDMLILGKSKEQLTGLLVQIKNRLWDEKLEFNEKKQILADIETGVDFLGYHLSAQGKTIPAKAEQSLEERLELMWLTTGETNIETKIKKAAEIIGGWEQYFREERKQFSIFEYITLVGLAGDNEERIKKLIDLRHSVNNIYRDIMEYLSSFWKDHGMPVLELLEYEQFYQIWEVREKELEDEDRNLILSLYRRYLINPNESLILELMQAYTDLREYGKASFWMEEKDKLSKKITSFQRTIIPPSVEENQDSIKWGKDTVSKFFKLLVGREDIYAIETLDSDHRRKNEFQALPLTEKILSRHLSGEYTIATYVQRSNSTVKFMIIDVDISKKIIMQYGNEGDEFREYLAKAARAAQIIIKIMNNFGMKAYIEYSGYRGYHVWVFFTEWIPVRYVNMLEDIIENHYDQDTDQEEAFSQSISIEFFPNKTRIKPGKFGQAIKLPYGLHYKTGKTSYFIDDAGEKVTDINPFLDTIAKYPLSTIKRVLASNTTYKEEKAPKPVDGDIEAFKDSPATVLEILKKCNLMRYLCQKSVKTAYLTHFERLSILYVFGHLGKDGHEFIHKVMSFTLNYQYNITEKFIRRCPEKPISCVKLRDQYKKVTAEIGCSCTFKRTKNCYPSPVMHAITGSNDLQADITLPTSRTITQEKKQKVLEEINIHKKAMELAKKILAYKKQKRSIDKSIEKTEKELCAIYDDAGIDVLEIEMGMLVRRKKGDSYEWLIEL